MKYIKQDLKNGTLIDENVFKHIEDGIECSQQELYYQSNDEFFNTGVIVGKDSTSTMNGYGFILTKEMITKPVSGVKVNLFIGGETNLPVNCELLDSSKKLIKNFTSQLTLSEDGTYVFDLKFSAEDITESFCYIAIYNADRTGGKWLGFNTIDSDGSEWYKTVSTSGIEPIYRYGTRTDWQKPSSYPKRYFALLTDETVYVKSEDIATKKYVTDTLSEFNIESSFPIIQCSDEYYAVEGDTLEIFYRSILFAKNALNYNIKAKCSVGTNYFYKFVVPSTTAVGTYPLYLEIYDDQRQLIDSKVINIHVIPKATSPSQPVNVLVMGASTVAAKTWPGELYRRFIETSTVSNIVGDGLTNINFVGKNKTKYDSGYEGFGGWSWANFISTDTSSGSYWVTVNSHSKTVSDQQSVYEDANGIQWQLETIEAKRLKFKKFGDTSGVMPSSGTLEYVSGGVDSSNVVFQSREAEKGNPFCYNGKVDFKAYCQDTGISGIDYIYGQIVFNDVPSTAEVITDSALNKKMDTIKTFIDALLRDYPNAKLVLVNSPLPSYDGCATNYTAKTIYQDWQLISEWVFKYQTHIYKNLKEMYPNNIYFCDINAQFDIDHGYPASEVTYNIRTTDKYVRQNNGVHPNESGYYQVADGVYRHLTNMLNTYNKA